MDYKQAGVDIEAGYKAVDLMKEHIKKTMRKEVLSDIGGFSGAFSLKRFMNMEEPTLVSGTDGVGTKLKIAFLLDKHDTVGIDCVAMCVNDIACSGAEPLFFLDYIACGKNEPERIASIVKGVGDAVVEVADAGDVLLVVGAGRDDDSPARGRRPGHDASRHRRGHRRVALGHQRQHFHQVAHLVVEFLALALQPVEDARSTSLLHVGEVLLEQEAAVDDQPAGVRHVGRGQAAAKSSVWPPWMRVDVQVERARAFGHHRHARLLAVERRGTARSSNALEHGAHVADGAVAEERHRAVRDAPLGLDLGPPDAAMAEADAVTCSAARG